MKRLRVLLYTILLVLVFIGLAAWPVLKQVRQNHLDQGFLAALQQGQPEEALAYLRQGADPILYEALQDQRPFWERVRGIFSTRRSHSTYGNLPNPLHMAIAKFNGGALVGDTAPPENSALIAALLDRGVDPNAIAYLSWHPLALAAMRDRREAIRLLLQRGVDINSANPQGETALMYAIDWSPRTVPFLLDQGASINVRNEWGRTALHYAIERGRADIVSLLIQRGADLNICDQGGMTPLSCARNTQHTKIIKMLERAGAKP
jgi:ankyrin repeat protein